MNAKEMIMNGKTALGIEFGSTRIKAVLIGEDCETLAVGGHQWENQLVDGVWTYSLDVIHGGLQSCYAALAADVKEKYGVALQKVGSIGISAMMHGYMAFNDKDELLVPFRTWRNTMTEEAAAKLTETFQVNVPERYSISHLYQAILKKEEHVKDVTFFTTLAGYIHWQLTGKRVLGVGDASGMFPIDCKTKDYDEDKLSKFDGLVADCGFSWKLKDILPECLVAGEDAGALTAEGAKMLDPTGTLEAGIAMCPPEGDAGTGMVATNSVEVRTGNVSAGTSVFAMIVMEEELKKLHTEIDLVTTPVGDLVAMVHCNNCTSDINTWVNLFKEFAEAMGMTVDMSTLFHLLFNKALEGEPDCGGLLSYNYFSGESITGFEEGRPLFVRSANDNVSLANFMRVHLFTALGALKNGLDILLKEEKVPVDKIYGHGGFFTVPGAGQKIMAAAMNTPVSVMDTASEGGAWGIAVLAQYLVQNADKESLADYLNNKVFAGQTGTTIEPDPADVKGFDDFLVRYNKGLPIERAAVESL